MALQVLGPVVSGGFTAALVWSGLPSSISISSFYSCLLITFLLDQFSIFFCFMGLSPDVHPVTHCILHLPHLL